jgi:hypothetical protein
MQGLRRASGIVARTEAKGLSAHFAAPAQIFERSRAAACRELIAPEGGFQICVDVVPRRLGGGGSKFFDCRDHFGE